MKGTWRNVGLLAAIGLVYFLVNPASSSIFPQCPFFVLTGYQCPGCGSQRATHSLLHGDLESAMHYNALFVFAIPYLLLTIYFYLFGGKDRHPEFFRVMTSQTTYYIWLIAALLFFVLRNIW
jgi:hypothetical protein